MRMSIRASAGLGAGLLFFLPASAAIIPLVPAPPEPTFSSTVEAGSFTNDYTFMLTTSGRLAAIDTIVLFPGSVFTSGQLRLFEGTPTTGTLEDSVSLMGVSPSGSLVDSLAPGTYYYEVTATVSGQLVNVLTAGAVPELGTWAMMVLGFASLGYAWYRRPTAARPPHL